MAFVSRISTLRFNGAAGAFRQWQATAAVQDTAEGQSVSIATEVTSGGVAPTAHTALVLNVYDSTGTLIKSFSLGTGTSFSSTYYFTNDGNVGGGGAAVRHGTVYIDLRATKSGGVDAYDYETDGSPSTAPTGFSAATVDRGWIRGTTTLIEAVSNISLGGGKNSPAEYDESLYVRCTLNSQSYSAQTLTVASSAGSLSSATNSTTSATRDVTFANVVDERFSAASASISWTVTPATDANTGTAYTAFSATTDDTITVDPRLTRSYHFQVDDNTFGVAKNDTMRQMLSTQSGFLWSIIRAARGTGINSLTVAHTLTPTNPGTAVSGSGSTSTQDSQAGVSARLDWTSSKPGGAWTMVADITAPSDIDGAGYLLQDTEVYTMLNADPRIRVICGGGNVSAPGRHWKPGDALTIGVSVIRGTTRLTFDSGTAKVALARLNATLGRAEFWNGTAWAFGDTVTQLATTPSAGDSKLGLVTIAGVDTASWGYEDLFLIGYVDVAGTPYSGPGRVEVMGLNNPHDSQKFDPTGLFA